MADRDCVAFTQFLFKEAIFFGGEPLRVKQQVAAAWKTSLGRLEPDGRWRIVFDKGDRDSEPPGGTSKD